MSTVAIDVQALLQRSGYAPQALPPGMVLRALSAKDTPAVLSVQRACYGAELIEPESVWLRRLHHSSHCSLALVQGNQVCAYLAAYASVCGKVTPLQGPFEAYADPNTLYLHDVAVLPHYAGQGLATCLVRAAWAIGAAAQWQSTALVAVQGAHRYWMRYGYVRQALTDALQQARLFTYGSDAIYMECALPDRELQGRDFPPLQD